LKSTPLGLGPPLAGGFAIGATMNIRRSSLSLALAAILAVSASAAATPRGSSSGVEPATAPAGTDPEVRRALRLAVAQHLAAAGLEPELAGFSVSPALLQLRRYVDPGQKRTKFVCVVGLSVQNEQREIVAEIRGSASTMGASQLDAVDAAAHSAVLRIAGTLAELKARGQGKRWAQR
jgi:hypothetical protein